MRSLPVVLLGLVASLLGCKDCDRQGCESLRQRAPERGTGIGGVVAAASDVVANGCQECAFESGGSVAIWEVEGFVSSPAAANQVLTPGDRGRPLARGGFTRCSRPGNTWFAPRPTASMSPWRPTRPRP
jgi:hypothetical protein